MRAGNGFAIFLFISAFLQLYNADPCGPDQFLGAGCESCEKICNPHDPYPDSCLTKCKKYLEKRRGISTSFMSTIATTSSVATPEDKHHTILYICLVVVALILIIVCILALRAPQKIRKVIESFHRQRQLRKLKHPMQAHQDPENHESVPLSNNFLHSSICIINENTNSRGHDITRPKVRPGSSSDLCNRSSCELSFGYVNNTVADGNTGNRTNQIRNVIGELGEEEFDFGATLPFCSASLNEMLSFFSEKPDLILHGQ